MSATPSSSKTKALFSALIMDAQKDYNFDMKKAGDVISLTDQILKIFYDVETTATTQKLAKVAEHGFFLSNMLTLSKKEDIINLGEKNKFFTYFLLSTSGEEFHNLFLKFFHEFDIDKDFVLTQYEFQQMMNFFCRKENVGREKIEKVFKKLFPGHYKNWNKLDRILDKNEEHELGPNLLNGVFQQMKCVDKNSFTFMNNKKPVIEYLRVLPVFTALYSQLILVRINKRKENLEMTRGVDELGDKIRLSESSLCDKFERLGIVYDKDDPATLTYRDIENALILFKNYYTSNFGQQQLNLVLADVQQKYKYSKKRGDFTKPPSFDQKFLTYLAFKVSIHGICHFIKNNQENFDQFPIIQEFIYWNIVIHGDKFNKDAISDKFINFAKKNPTKPLDELFSQFIVKIVPLIPRQIGQNILNKYFTRSGGSVDIQDFADHLYDALVREAEDKLHSYLEMSYDKITKQTTQMAEAENVRRKSIFAKHKGSQDILPKSVMATPKLEAVADVSYHGASQDFNLNDVSARSRKPSVMTANRNEELYHASEHDRRNSQMYSRSNIRPSEMPSMSEHTRPTDFMKPERIPLESLDAPKDSFHFERKSANKSMMTGHNHSQSGIMSDRDQNDGQPKQDYLNSCFIMETFLHNFLYEKQFGTGAPNRKKKETQATRRMSVSNPRKSRRMTKGVEGIDVLPRDSFHEYPESEHSALPSERNTHQGFVPNPQNYDDQQFRQSFQQQAQQQNFERATTKSRFTGTPMPIDPRIKESYELRKEFGDVDEFNSDEIYFKRKDLSGRDRDGGLCGINGCNMF